MKKYKVTWVVKANCQSRCDEMEVEADTVQEARAYVKDLVDRTGHHPFHLEAKVIKENR